MSASRSWNATKTGTVMGTPAYMAPEQRAGEPTNALSDQYSFCVTAIEILFGYRPGEDGRIHPHDLERLPKPVRKSLAEVLQRGLARDPDDRFATLGDLLDALDRARSRPRRRLVVLSAGLGAVALAALVLSAPTRRCDDRDPLAGVWPEANRERVEARLGEVDPARGQRTVEALDDYASAYARAHAQVCQPTEAPDDPRRFDVQMSCLRRARQALAARVEVLTEDGVAMEEPARAVSALPRPQACVEAAESALTGLSPETEHEITGLEAELDRIEALRVVGRTQEALEKAEALEARTRSSNAPQLRAELLVVLTTTRMDLTMFEAATQSGLEAYELAAKIRLDDLAATAALRLAHAYGHQLGRPQEGLRWLEQAEALAPRTSDPDLRRAEIAFARGSILEEVAEYGDEGVAELERAIRLADELEGESYEVEYARLAARANLASAYNDRGRGDDALALFEQVYGLSTEMRGPEHPLTLGVAYNMALVYQLLGRLEDAVDVLEQASQYTRTGRGPSLVAIMVEANLLDYRYDLGEADLIADRLLELHAEMKALPEVLPDSLPILETVVARACRHEGRFDEAVQWANSALRGFESVWGLDGSRAAYGHAELASALYARGERDEAVRHLQRAHDIIEANTAPDNPDLARIRQNLDEWTGGG
jgi:tetratricopeptide (TPR) repeat protein